MVEMLPFTGRTGNTSGGTGRDGFTMAAESSYYMTAGRNLNGMLNGGPVTQFQLNEMIRSQQQSSGCVIPQSGNMQHTTTTTFPRSSR